MKVGEHAILRLSSEYGYGARGSPPKIPGGASLDFDVELLDFKEKEKQKWVGECVSVSQSARELGERLDGSQLCWSIHSTHHSVNRIPPCYSTPPHHATTTSPTTPTCEDRNKGSSTGAVAGSGVSPAGGSAALLCS